MLRIEIKKNNIVTNKAIFETKIEMDLWIKEQEQVKAFGEPAWIEEVPEKITLEEIDGVQYQKTTPGYQIVHPAEYELIIEDMTAQIEAEKAQLEAIQAAQQQAGMRLMLFPQQVDDCHDLEALKLAIKQMVSDIAVLLVK